MKLFIIALFISILFMIGAYYITWTSPENEITSQNVGKIWIK